VSFGAGPRASQYLVLGAKARAALRGRPSPELADVQAVAVPVLAHRVVVTYKAEASGVRAADLVRMVLEGVKKS
jgi:MoxR-like ATPase